MIVYPGTYLTGRLNMLIGKSDKFMDEFTENILKIKKNYEPQKIALKAASIFFIGSILWIIISDGIVRSLNTDLNTFTLVSMVKGSIFILLTGMHIYFLILSAMKKLQSIEKKLQESYEKVKYNEERYRLVLQSSNDGIWDMNLKTESTFFSDRFYEITGYNKDEIKGTDKWRSLIHPNDLSKIEKIILEHIKHRTAFYYCVYRFKTKNGDYKWVRERGKAFFDENGLIYRTAGSLTDVNKLKRYQQELVKLAYNDYLTNLLNKRALNLRLNNIIREGNPSGALYLINIDNFKYINDTIGHSFGDKLLIKIGQLLEETQLQGCTVYRLGDDDFVLLARGTSDPDLVRKAAEDIIGRIRIPIKIDNITLHITASIGIVLLNGCGKNSDEVLRNADIAMYKAKEMGKNRIMFYSDFLVEPINRRITLEKYLHPAVENREFVLYYQPQADIHTGEVTGFEALIRWMSPDLGTVSPQEFIWVLEDTQLIIEVGKWILKEACCFIKTIHGNGYTECSVSVNISIIQLMQDNFVDIVMDALREAALESRYLEIELTESILMESFEIINGKLELLKSKGIKIALDDFGKGYSSFSYLKQLPITTLKIDKSFIDNIAVEKKSNYITGIIIELGKQIGLSVVAEGVETVDQLTALKKYDCEKIQGYLYCKPKPVEEIIKFMETKHKLV